MFIVVYVVLCFFSPQLYAFMSAFRNKQNNSYEFWFKVSMVFESIFLLDIVLKCFKETLPRDSTLYLNDFLSIFRYYLRNGFIWDFIPIIPFQFLTLQNNRERLFFYIKVIRMRECFNYFNKRTILSQIKKWQLEYLSSFKQSEDQSEMILSERNITKNELILIISFSVKTLELIFIILFMSYHFGMLWFVLCETIDDILSSSQS